MQKSLRYALPSAFLSKPPSTNPFITSSTYTLFKPSSDASWVIVCASFLQSTTIWSLRSGVKRYIALAALPRNDVLTTAGAYDDLDLLVSIKTPRNNRYQLYCVVQSGSCMVSDNPAGDRL